MFLEGVIFKVGDYVKVSPSGQTGNIMDIIADANNNIWYVIRTYWEQANKNYIGSYKASQIERIKE